MSKIATICCIIAAVYIIQNAEAARFLPINPLGILPINPLSSLLGGNKQEPEVKQEDEIDAIVSSFQIPIPFLNSRMSMGTILRAIENFDISGCANLYNDGREAVGQLKSIVDTCVKNEMNNVDIEKLKDIKNSLQQAVAKETQQLEKCLKKPLSAVSCVTKMLQDRNLLNSIIDEAKIAAAELASFLPNVKDCAQAEFLQFVQDNSSKLIKSVAQCYQSVKQILENAAYE